MARKIEISNKVTKYIVPGIPSVLHFVWISKKRAKASDIPNNQYKNLLETIELASSSEVNWKINLWTDKKTIKCDKIQQLKTHKINIINIDIPGAIFNNGFIDDEFASGSKYQKELYVSSYNLAIKIDILKYQLLKEFGGIVSDLNFIYERLPNTKELQDNALMLYKTTNSIDIKMYFENFFMASSPDHEYIRAAQTYIAVNVRDFLFCLDKYPKFPEETNQMLINQVGLDNLSRVKKTYCSSVITLDGLEHIDLSLFPYTTISKVFQETCYEGLCFGYDTASYGGEMEVQSWL